MKATLSIHQLYAGSTLRQAHPLRGRSAPAAGGASGADAEDLPVNGGALCLLRLLIFHTFANKLPKFRYDYRKRCY